MVVIHLNIIIFPIRRQEAEKWGGMEFYKCLICVNSHISKLVSRKHNRSITGENGLERIPAVGVAILSHLSHGALLLRALWLMKYVSLFGSELSMGLHQALCIHTVVL